MTGSERNNRYCNKCGKSISTCDRSAKILHALRCRKLGFEGGY
jgi:predicted RNA-binding Zn-ribbon protein involved in translation (DUF1610 family)